MAKKLRIGLVKMGNIGTSAMLDLILDERAEREDIDFRITGSGPKITEEDCEEVSEKILDFNPELIIAISPNPALPGPSKARVILSKSGKPIIIVGDSPGAKIAGDLEKAGIGYIFVEADSMLGARREFLDPIEMSLFNADVIKVLSVTGALRVVYEEIDKAIEGIKLGTPYLPRVIINREKAVETAKFENPYARAKAMAAFGIAKKVADVSVEGCFKVKEKEKYIKIVAAAHEMMHAAAELCDEAREMEKSGDSVLRRPHGRNGERLSKKQLMETEK